MKSRKVGLVIVMALVAGLVLFNRKDILLTGQRLSLKPAGTGGYELSSQMTLYNGNFLSATIINIQEDVYINGVKVGELINEINQGIPGGKETVFPVTIRFSKEDVPLDILNLLIKGDNVEVSLKGEIPFQKIVTGGKIIINQKDSIYVSE